jgi:hypothetical protein
VARLGSGLSAAGVDAGETAVGAARGVTTQLRVHLSALLSRS